MDEIASIFGRLLGMGLIGFLLYNLFWLPAKIKFINKIYYCVFLIILGLAIVVRTFVIISTSDNYLNNNSRTLFFGFYFLSIILFTAYKIYLSNNKK